MNKPKTPMKHDLIATGILLVATLLLAMAWHFLLDGPEIPAQLPQQAVRDS